MKLKKLNELLRYQEDSVRLFKEASDPNLLSGSNSFIRDLRKELTIK